jgi:AcrR family transcriptional regulator
MDPRVRRTRDRLGDALWELMQERPLESITVQQVLERAAVGRSTFYAHFRDKDDLFLSDVDEFLVLMSTLLAQRADGSERVVAAAEFFAHVGESPQYFRALVASGRLADFRDLAQEHYARGIEQRLATLPRAAHLPAERRVALSQAFAGAFLSLLFWWIDHGTPGTPLEMDRLFHRLVWSGVDAPRDPQS